MVISREPKNLTKLGNLVQNQKCEGMDNKGEFKKPAELEDTGGSRLIWPGVQPASVMPEIGSVTTHTDQ